MTMELGDAILAAVFGGIGAFMILGGIHGLWYDWAHDRLSDGQSGAFIAIGAFVLIVVMSGFAG